MRYALFAHDTYYPWGGWRDLVEVFSDMEAVAAWVAEHKPDEWHVVNLDTLMVVTWDSQDCAEFQMAWPYFEKHGSR